MHSNAKDADVDLRADSKLLILLCGRIAQLVRALASHARGRRFESYCDHHKNLPFTALRLIIGSLSLLKKLWNQSELCGLLCRVKLKRCCVSRPILSEGRDYLAVVIAEPKG